MSILLFLIPLMFSSLLAVCQSRSRDYHAAMWFFLIPLIIVGLFRWEIGTDWPSYLDIFNAIGSGVDTVYEPGWVALNLFSSYFSDFRFFVFFVYSIIIFLIIGIYCKFPYAITILFFICFYRFGVFFTRIDLAAILFIFFVSYRRPFLSFLAVAFHKVLILSPVIYLFSMTPRVKRLLYLLFVFCIVAFIFRDGFLAFFLSKFGQTFSTHYEELSNVSVNRVNSFLKLCVLLGIVLFSFSKESKKRFNIVCIIFLLLIWLGENFISQGLARLYSLSFPFFFFLVSRGWKEFTLVNRFVLVFLFLVVFLGWTMSPFYSLHFPIKLWWFEYL